MTEELLRVDGLVKHFPITKGLLRRRVGTVSAVDGVSLSVKAGETMGVVGESGSGKSTMARCILRLLEPTTGSIIFDGKDVLGLDSEELRAFRRDAQIIFQDPYASLNPRMTVGEIAAEPMVVHKVAKAERLGRVRDLIQRVGLNPEHLSRYPHEFSGGQRQRIGIARALALNPRLIICDEPVSALDVSIQAQIINLLEELQSELGLTYIFIAHDLSVVRHISDHVAVMYLGKIVETASRDNLYERPLHPYTQALLSAVPIPDPQKERRKQRIVLRGDLPSPSNPPSGCRFHTRCFKTREVAASGGVESCEIGRSRTRVAKICVDEQPKLAEQENGQLVACHFAEARQIL